MNLDNIRAVVTSNSARQLLLARKHSPKILFAGGVVGVVGATVLACRATLKVSDVLDKHEKNAYDLNDSRYTADQHGGELDRQKEINKLKVKTAGEIAKLYIPAVGLGVVSIAALTGSQIILTKRNASVMAAYAGLQKAYDEYRSRVAGKYGEDEDRLFASPLERKSLEEKMADGSVKKTDGLRDTGRFGGSPYAALFDEKSKHWTIEPGMNEHILTMKMSHANDKLRAKGHLFLNEVYDLLDLPRTKAGAVVGWVWRRETEEKTGDNYVSFGLFENEPDLVDSFLDGHDKSVWLDFNVDGIILDLI